MAGFVSPRCVSEQPTDQRPERIVPTPPDTHSAFIRSKEDAPKIAFTLPGLNRQTDTFRLSAPKDPPGKGETFQNACLHLMTLAAYPALRGTTQPGSDSEYLDLMVQCVISLKDLTNYVRGTHFIQPLLNLPFHWQSDKVSRITLYTNPWCTDTITPCIA